MYGYAEGDWAVIDADIAVPAVLVSESKYRLGMEVMEGDSVWSIAVSLPLDLLSSSILGSYAT